jgi:hypothetical protein
MSSKRLGSAFVAVIGLLLLSSGSTSSQAQVTTVVVPKALFEAPSRDAIPPVLTASVDELVCVQALLRDAASRDASGNLVFAIGGFDQPAACSRAGARITLYDGIGRKLRETVPVQVGGRSTLGSLEVVDEVQAGFVQGRVSIQTSVDIGFLPVRPLVLFLPERRSGPAPLAEALRLATPMAVEGDFSKVMPPGRYDAALSTPRLRLLGSQLSLSVTAITPPALGGVEVTVRPGEITRVDLNTRFEQPDPAETSSGATSIRGSLIDPAGSPAASTLVELRRVGPLPPGAPYGWSLLTVDGRFEFSCLEPGSFHVLVFWNPGFFGNPSLDVVSLEVTPGETGLLAVDLVVNPLPQGVTPYPVRSGPNPLAPVGQGTVCVQPVVEQRPPAAVVPPNTGDAGIR